MVPIISIWEEGSQSLLTESEPIQCTDEDDQAIDMMRSVGVCSSQVSIHEKERLTKTIAD